MPITEAFSESLTAHPMYTWTVLGVVVLGIVSFVLLMFISAPYGRHLRPGWGPTLNATALWVIMEAPSPIAFGVVYFMSDNAFKPVPLILLGMYMFHYLYRSFIYPFRMRGGHKQKPLVTGLLAFCLQHRQRLDQRVRDHDPLASPVEHRLADRPAVHHRRDRFRGWLRHQPAIRRDPSEPSKTR